MAGNGRVAAWLLVVCAMATAVSLDAQRRGMSGAPPPVVVRGRSQPVTLPFPPLMPPPTGGLTGGVRFIPPRNPTVPPRDVFRARPGTYRAQPYVIFPGAGYTGPYVTGDEQTVTAPASAIGRLRVTGTPGSALVFVDSYYVGTVADVEDRRAIDLPAGQHRLEITAAGYEPAAVDVVVPSGDTITYRSALTPRAAPAQPAQAGSTRMYVIHDCYLGNVPPRAERLPAGCDIKRTEVIGG